MYKIIEWFTTENESSNKDKNETTEKDKKESTGKDTTELMNIDELETMAKEIYNNTYGNPIIATPYGSRYMINADATASGSYYKPIENWINSNVVPYYNNTHSNSFSGQMMNQFIAQSKEKIAKSVNATKTDKILFTGNGCTGAIQHIIHLLKLKDSSQKAAVFISEAEHHSNDLPWRHLPIDLIVIPIDKETGLIRMDKLKKYLKKYNDRKVKLISMIAASNITGIIQPIDEICILGHRYGAIVMFDYATGGSYLPINMHKDDSNGNYIDILVFSLHKFLGGPNTPGLIVFREKCCKNTIPFCPGGGTVRFVTEQIQKYSDDVETRENGGTPNIVGSIKAGFCFEVKDKYQSYISKREEWLVRYIDKRMRKIKDKLEIINPKDNLHRLPIFSFRVPDIHYNLIVVLLNDLFGIQSRGGISCCSMYAQKILDISDEKKKEILKSIVENKGVPSFYGWCRITFHYSMPKYIVDYILDAIEFVSTYAKLLKSSYMYDAAKNNWYYSPIDKPTNRSKLIDVLLEKTMTLQNNTYPSQSDLDTIQSLNLSIIKDIKN